MKKIKDFLQSKKVKKISTTITCCLVVAMIVSLSVIAYYRTETSPEGQTFEYMKVSILSDTGFDGSSFTSEAKLNPGANVSSDTCYMSLQDAVSGQDIPYAPTVTNNGEGPIYAYVVVTMPMLTKEESGSYTSTPVFSLDSVDFSKWKEIKNAPGLHLPDGRTQKSSFSDNIYDDIRYEYYIYTYKTALAPGETTTPLCQSIHSEKIEDVYIGANQTPLSTDDTDHAVTVEQLVYPVRYTNLPIQTTFIGSQPVMFTPGGLRAPQPVRILSEYDDSFDGHNVTGPESTFEALELYNYLNDNVYVINPNIDDEPTPQH